MVIKGIKQAISSNIRSVGLYNRLLKRYGYVQINKYLVLVHVPPNKTKPYRQMLFFNIMLIATVFFLHLEDYLSYYWSVFLLAFLTLFTFYCFFVVSRQSVLVIRPLTRYWKKSEDYLDKGTPINVDINNLASQTIREDVRSSIQSLKDRKQVKDKSTDNEVIAEVKLE